MKKMGKIILAIGIFCFLISLNPLFAQQSGYFMVKGDGNVSVMYYTSSNSFQYVSGKAGENLAVAPGTYTLYGVAVHKTHSDGSQWSTTCKMFQKVTVESGKVYSLGKVTGPTKATVQAEKSGNSYYFTLKLTDNQGKEYTYFEKNNQRLTAPGFLVENKNGKQIAKGNFSYG